VDESPPDFDEDPDESPEDEDPDESPEEDDEAAESLPGFDADGTEAAESLLRLSVR
jgi:hypothetical protein